MSSNANKPTAPQQVRARERERQVLELRMTGAKYDEIAAKIGITKGTVSRILKRVLEGINKEITEKAEEMRSVELGRIEKLISVLWPAAIGEAEATKKQGPGKKQKPDHRSIDRIISLMKRKADLLGLDAPVKKTIELPHMDRGQVKIVMPDNKRGPLPENIDTPLQ